MLIAVIMQSSLKINCATSRAKSVLNVWYVRQRFFQFCYVVHNERGQFWLRNEWWACWRLRSFGRRARLKTSRSVEELGKGCQESGHLFAAYRSIYVAKWSGWPYTALPAPACEMPEQMTRIPIHSPSDHSVEPMPISKSQVALYDQCSRRKVSLVLSRNLRLWQQPS